MCNRHLALAEAPDLHLILELAETGGEAFAKLALTDDYLELALETADGGLADLHNICLNHRLCAHRTCACGTTCPPCATPVVRAEGLEPPRLASQEPKSCASASSATPAGFATPKSRGGLAAGRPNPRIDIATARRWPG